MTQTPGAGFHTQAIAFQTSADDLERMALGIARTGAKSTKVARYLISVPVLRGLATECALKALSERSTGRYERIHDLVELYEDLNEGVRRIAESIAEHGGIVPPLTILEKHRRDFVDWRYPGSLSTNAADLPKALEVLLTTWRHNDFHQLCADLAARR